MEYDLNIGKVTYVKSDMTAGSVVEQSVTAWLEVPQYSEIDFKVSGGASYSGDGTTIPTDKDMNYVPETEPETEPEPDYDDNDDSYYDDYNDNYDDETNSDSDEDDWFMNGFGLVSNGGNLFKGPDR